MAPEQQQTEFQQGAGLTESRLNRDFIDFLKKWGGVILMVILAVTAGYLGLRRLAEHREQKLAIAFDEYQAARTAGNPSGLIQIADTHAGQGAVPIMARIAAADVFRVSAYRGLTPGAQLEDTGAVKDPKDILNAEGRERLLTQAAEQYQKALDEAGGDDGMALLSISARFGLSAVAETRGNTDEARKHLEAAQALATRTGWTALADTAKRYIETMGQFTQRPVLLTNDQVKTAAPRNLPGTIPPEVLEQLQRTGSAVVPVMGNEQQGPILPPFLPADEPPAFPGGVRPPPATPPVTPPANDPTKDTP